MFTDGALMYIAMDWTIFACCSALINWPQGMIAILKKVSKWIMLDKPIRTIE